MAFYEVLQPLLSLPRFLGQLHNVSETLMQQLSSSMANAACSTDGAGAAEDCRDDASALQLKVVAFTAILAAGAAGVTIPLIGKKRWFLGTAPSGAFAVTKAFAAGIILATGFVHMLPDGQAALADPCLPQWPWSAFPFAGFVAMAAALGTLVLDALGTQLYERKHRRGKEEARAPAAVEDEGSVAGPSSVAAEEETMHTEVTHLHSHPSWGAPHVGAAPTGTDEVEDSGPSSTTRHAVVSQILEVGIVSHSVIIGLSLGVSQSPCTIRPLVAALSFHQFFEGFALGGCISQAQFGAIPATLMASFFTVTTPAGVGAGAGLLSSYNPDSPRALVVEGLLGSISAGILIYMALVDLIAADFLGRSMSSYSIRLQMSMYVALFLGALSMSLLAIWA